MSRVCSRTGNWVSYRRLNDGSRMSREVQVRFCEQRGGKFPSLTHLIVTGCSKELLRDYVLPAIEKFLAERGLTLSREKTKITQVEEGFDFLGQNIRKQSGKLAIQPS